MRGLHDLEWIAAMRNLSLFFVPIFVDFYTRACGCAPIGIIAGFFGIVAL